MKQKDILFILIFSFIITVLWIGFTIKHNVDTSTISETLNLQIQPISPSFDMVTIQALKQRNVITPNYTIDVVKNDSLQETNEASSAATQVAEDTSRQQPTTLSITPIPTADPAVLPDDTNFSSDESFLQGVEE